MLFIDSEVNVMNPKYGNKLLCFLIYNIIRSFLKMAFYMPNVKIFDMSPKDS